MKREKKRQFVRILWITLYLILFLMICPYHNINSYIASYATNNDEMIQEQEEEFGIQDFLKGAKQYAGDFLGDIDLGEILNEAMKGEIDNVSIGNKIWNLLGTEFFTTIRTIGSILVIIVIHSILKSISESLENDGISKLIYYAQYILIITIVLTNFSDIVKMVQDTTTNLVAFMNMLIPLLITLMMSTGSIATSGVLEPIILFMINFIR